MRYEARIVAYDVLDHVFVQLHAWEAPDGPTKELPAGIRITTNVAGVGESDLSEWCRDVLIALLEDL